MDLSADRHTHEEQTSYIGEVLSINIAIPEAIKQPFQVEHNHGRANPRDKMAAL